MQHPTHGNKPTTPAGTVGDSKCPYSPGPGAAMTIALAGTHAVLDPGWLLPVQRTSIRAILRNAGFTERVSGAQWLWSRAVPEFSLEHEIVFKGPIAGKAWIADGIVVQACTVHHGRQGRRLFGPALAELQTSFTGSGQAQLTNILNGFARNETLWRRGGTLESFPDWC